MNVLCDFQKQNDVEPAEWALETQKSIFEAKTLDFKILNKVLLDRYKLLGSSFISKLQKHREKQYFLASSEGFNFLTKEYATEQVAVF